MDLAHVCRCWTRAHLAEIGTVKAALFLLQTVTKPIGMCHEIIWNFQLKERLGTICLLRHGVQNFCNLVSVVSGVGNWLGYIIIVNQQDATISQIYYLTFMYGSTCFGRPHAHHRELNNCSSSLWFYRWSVVIAVLLVVVGPAGPTTTNRT